MEKVRGLTPGVLEDALTRCNAYPNYKVLILCSNLIRAEELAESIQEEFWEQGIINVYGIEIGMFGGNVVFNNNSHISIRHCNDMGYFDKGIFHFIVYDEDSNSKSIMEIINKCTVIDYEDEGSKQYQATPELKEFLNSFEINK